MKIRPKKPQWHSLITALFCLLNWAGLALLLAACSRYSVSINKNVIYHPPSVFSGYQVADPDLKRCIQETIAEGSLIKAEQLIRLICPPGNIQNLEGLELFSNIRFLGLAQNRVKDITTLADLSQLEQADVSYNSIRDFSPLITLTKLTFLNAIGNPEAECSSLRLTVTPSTVKLPKHCLANIPD